MVPEFSRGTEKGAQTQAGVTSGSRSPRQKKTKAGSTAGTQATRSLSTSKFGAAAAPRQHAEFGADHRSRSKSAAEQ